MNTHKRSHTLVALDAATCVERGQLTIPDLSRWNVGRAAVRGCAGQRAGVGRGGLPARVRTLGARAARQRRSRRRVALREGIDTLPVAFPDEQAHEIRVLNDYRRQLVSERVRLINRLRWHLVQIAAEIEAQIKPAGLIGPRIRARVARLPRTPQLGVAKAILKRVCENYREENELFAELKTLIEAHCPALLEEPGCGPVTAAIIIGHTAGARRFPSDACFARHAGTAPIPASSGNTKRHRLHRGGERQLNHAIHIIALSRARTDPTTRAYLDRRHSEGKTKKEALRCLQTPPRTPHLATALRRTATAAASRANQRDTVTVGAPVLMPRTR